MLDSLVTYIPQDRRQALALDTPIPDRLTGAVLFADISGFTPLTEALTRALGPRRGAEAITTSINTVFDALITAVEHYRGSVLTFSGDAITCWFADPALPQAGDATPAALRAAACALALQQVMQAFAVIPIPGGNGQLALKVAVAYGPVRRFVVGDPTIQVIDTLAGATIDRVAEAEHLAAPGEIILDTPCIAALADAAEIGAWRTESGDRFGMLVGLRRPVDPLPWPAFPTTALHTTTIRPWLLPTIYAREQAGMGEFLTEFRPVAALFVRFQGIDYDQDAAEAQLDAFIRLTQQILGRYDGTLIQVTIGDKGAYLYAAFGAPVAHEDDHQRAIRAALDLRTHAAALGTIQPLQISISYGTFRTGAYGGRTRRTYGVMGDEVNLAARLMELAEPGEIILTDRVQAAVAAEFMIEPLAAVLVKGKSEPVPIFRLTGKHQRRAGRLQPLPYALPMVGRQEELTRVGACMAQALAGHGQLIGITGAAGMGKSRLMAEIIRQANRQGMAGYGGSCRADSTTTPYFVWGAIWQALFDVDPAGGLRRQFRAVERLVDEWAPERLPALPLLGPLLDVSMAENDFTRALEPLDRKNTLHRLLHDCLVAAAREAATDGVGLLLVLEDAHWIDPASHDLLAEFARLIRDLPVLLVLTYRPFDTPLAPLPPLAAEIALTELGPDEVGHAIHAKLAQLFPARTGATPPALIDLLQARAQGNPFYLEELLNYLRDRGIDPYDPAVLTTLELPNSLHSLILSRIDQLSTPQQLAIKVASVLGRRFGFTALTQIYPGLIAPIQLRAELEQLATLDLTPLDTPEPELAYLFKHVVTQEVAYESLAYATRAVLHEQIGAHLEHATDDLIRVVDLLAYHYEHSENLPRKRYYLRWAGEIAAARYANDSALAYLGRALALAPDAEVAERYMLLRTREQVYALQAARDVQQQDLVEMEALADALGDQTRRAEVAVRQANYAYRIGAYAQAAEIAALAADAEVTPLAVAAQQEWAWALIGQGKYDLAQARAEECRRRAELLGDQRAVCKALQALGEIAGYQGDHASELSYYRQALAIAHASADRRAEGLILNNMSVVATEQGDYPAARQFAEQNLRITQEIGNRRGEGQALGNLGNIAMQQGDYPAARQHLEACLAIMQGSGNRPHEALALMNLGTALRFMGDTIAAERYACAALEIAQVIADQDVLAYAHFLLGDALLGQGRTADAQVSYQAALELRRALAQPHLVAEIQAGLARTALALGAPDVAVAQVAEILGFLEGGGSLDGVEHPLQVMLTCHEVLAQAADPRAAAVLSSAHTLLQERAARISDTDAQRMFLEQVPYHRAILLAASAA